MTSDIYALQDMLTAAESRLERAKYIDNFQRAQYEEKEAKARIVEVLARMKEVDLFS